MTQRLNGAVEGRKKWIDLTLVLQALNR